MCKAILLRITLCLIDGFANISFFGYQSLGLLIFDTICALWIVDLLKALPILRTIVDQVTCNLLSAILLFLCALNTLRGHGIR